MVDFKHLNEIIANLIKITQNCILTVCLKNRLFSIFHRRWFKFTYYMMVDTAREGALAELLKLESFDSGLTINGATGTIAAKVIDQTSTTLFNPDI